MVDVTPLPKTKRKKKPTKTTLRNRADAAFSKWIRQRDGACRACGRSSGLQCAHIVSRRYLAIRWDPANAVTLCRNCHVFFTMRPLEWDVWADAAIGATVHAGLKRKALAGVKATDIDYPSIIKVYEVA